MMKKGTLLTRNRRHFEQIPGLKLDDPTDKQIHP